MKRWSPSLRTVLFLGGAMYAAAWLCGCEDSGGLDPATYQAVLATPDATAPTDDAGLPE